MVKENEKRRGEGGGMMAVVVERKRSAHESQEVVVIVTVSLYLSIRAISGISLLWGKKNIAHSKARELL